ncbi:MAG: GIY-YIG nuclease family protein [Pseudomonadota bacterium]
MNLEQTPTVYLLASRRSGTLYVGVTSDLVGRIHHHRTNAVSGFTQKYGVKLLVWFEAHVSMQEAIMREKRIKKWNRAWKLELIERANPAWRDLAESFGFEPLV